MDNTMHKALRSVIEETDEAYRSYFDYNTPNTDFAEFAGLALTQFKSAMRSPDLTSEDLQQLLRSGMSNHRSSGGTDKGWSSFMASYVTRAVNAQTHELA